MEVVKGMNYKDMRAVYLKVASYSDLSLTLKGKMKKHGVAFAKSHTSTRMNEGECD